MRQRLVQCKFTSTTGEFRVLLFLKFLPLKFVLNSQDVSILLMPFSVKMVMHNGCLFILSCRYRLCWKSTLNDAVTLCRVPRADVPIV